MTLRKQIITYLTHVPADTADEIARVLGLPRDEVQAELRQMDDDGALLMRHGWYRLSEAQKAKMAYEKEKS